MTGHGREDVVGLVDDDCLDGFVLKPVDPSLLFDAVVAAVGRRGRGRVRVPPEEDVASAPAGSVCTAMSPSLKETSLLALISTE